MGNETTGENQETNQENDEQKIERLRNERDTANKNVKTMEAQKSHWKKKAEAKKESSAKTETKQPGEFDYGEKTFINNILGVKISNSDQMELVKDYLSNGKNLDDLVDNKHFKNDLKDIKDNQDAKSAVPSGHRGGGGGSVKDSVDYYLSKDEMPPIDKPELRKEYVNEKYKRAKNVSHFAK